MREPKRHKLIANIKTEGRERTFLCDQSNYKVFLINYYQRSSVLALNFSLLLILLEEKWSLMHVGVVKLHFL
jgi:hypothetical protein